MFGGDPAIITAEVAMSKIELIGRRRRRFCGSSGLPGRPGTAAKGPSCDVTGRLRCYSRSGVSALASRCKSAATRASRRP